ncbi:unnamed protein product [Linum tenue]|nr:unnamed protein product [Linum tenue]
MFPDKQRSQQLNEVAV